jgi:hypothetical protein
MPATIGSTGLYASFTVLVIALLAVDFFMLKKEGAHTVGTREAAAWSMVWVAIALAFGALFWGYLAGFNSTEMARTKALEYFTGYLIEKSLAAGNVLAWIALFHTSRCRPRCKSACCRTACWARSACAPSSSTSAPSCWRASTGSSTRSACCCWRPA